MRKKAWEVGGIGVTYVDQQVWLTGMWWTHRGKLDSLVLSVQRGKLRRLERSHEGFFRKTKVGKTRGHPKFQTTQRWHSIELAETHPGKVKGTQVKIKGLPATNIKGGELPDSSQLKALRMTHKGGHVKVNLTHSEEAISLPSLDTAVGIDMGVSHRIAPSTGEAINRRTIDPDSIAEKQRRLFPCRKGCREWRRWRTIQSNSNALGRERVRNRHQCAGLPLILSGNTGA